MSHQPIEPHGSARDHHVIPADAGTQRKTKHAISLPLRKAKGDASAASRGMPEIHRSTQTTQHPILTHPSKSFTS